MGQRRCHEAESFKDAKQSLGTVEGAGEEGLSGQRKEREQRPGGRKAGRQFSTWEHSSGAGAQGVWGHVEVAPPFPGPLFSLALGEESGGL